MSSRRFKESPKESQIISFIIPFELEKPDPAIETLISSSNVPTSLSTIFKKVSPEAVEGLRWALKRGRPVDIDIQATLTDSLLEGFEDLIAKASADLETVPPIVLCELVLVTFMLAAFLIFWKPTSFPLLMISISQLLSS